MPSLCWPFSTDGAANGTPATPANDSAICRYLVAQDNMWPPLLFIFLEMVYEPNQTTHLQSVLRGWGSDRTVS